MICSVNEITALLYKASVGSGRSVGLAQDISRAGAWLCTNGHDGVAVTIRYLATNEQEPSWPVLLGLVAAGVHDKVTIIDVGDGLMLGALANVLGPDSEITYEIHQIDRITTVSCRPGYTSPNSYPIRAVEVNDSDLATASKLASRTYVPASDASRMKGAGSGLTDND